MENNLSAAQILKKRIETQCVLNQTKRKNEAHEWLKENHQLECEYKKELYAINLQDKQNKVNHKARVRDLKEKERQLFLNKLQKEVDS